MAYMRLGDLLVASGTITGQQLERALALQKETKQRLGDVLIQNGFITEAQLIDALRVQLGVDFVDLTAISIPVELAQYVPRNIAKKYCVVPVKLVRNSLYLAMSDPLDFVAQDEVKTASRKRIIPMIATRKAVEQAISRLYGNEGTARVIEEMKREAGSSSDVIPAQMAQDTADPQESAPTIRFVNALIERAYTERASDIHLEPQEGEMVVRMRIDGLLRRILTVPADLQNTVISRLKIMGGMNIAEHKIPQDGHAIQSVRGHSLDLRISSMPTVYGEKMVLRLLDKSAQALSKSQLGLEGQDLDNYNALLRNTSGVILLVGPTGSGKSTTMCNMIRDLSREEINIVTLEDPVEYYIPGVIRAYDEFEAASRLRETVAIITRLEEVQEKKESIFNRPIGLKIKEKELALICSQFAIILSAGMSIQHCVEMVAAQTRNRHIRQMLEKVAEEVGAGYSMAQSFENNAPYLPKTFIETVRAGEQSGTLEECFQRLHRYYDKSAKTKAKVVSTLTYPAMVIVVAIVVFIIIIAVAVPAFNDVFAEMDTQLPGITRVLLAISDFFVGWWWLLLLIAAGLGIAYMVARRSIRGRRAIAAWSLTKAPLHRLHSLSAAAQFAHSMATMLTAGLPVPKALDVTGNVISNYTFALAVQEVKQKVERGRTISESMGQIEYFPKMLTEMVGVGEQSGSLEETLDVIGEYFDNEVEVTTARLLSVLEPIITIALAVIVVVLLLAVYLPLFTLYGGM